MPVQYSLYRVPTYMYLAMSLVSVGCRVVCFRTRCSVFHYCRHSARSVFKVEAQHLVMFMFTGSRVALLWVYMTVICCWMSGSKSRRMRGAELSVRQVTVVLGGSGPTVSRESH